MKYPLHHSDFILQKAHMDIKLSYSLTALQMAAQYIWEKNTSVTQWPCKPKSVIDVMDRITSMMRESALKNANVIVREKELSTDLASEWNTFTGTGGFYLLFELYDAGEDEISIGVDILIDPSVGHAEPAYVSELVDKIVEEV